MASNPSIEKIYAEILSILGTSEVEKIETFEIPFKYNSDDPELAALLEVNSDYYSVEPPIYNIFKTAIKTNASIELISFPLSAGGISDVERLSNYLYEILKNHTAAGLGKFNKTDAGQFNEGKIWSGKLWIDYSTTSLVKLDMHNGITTLSIIKRE